MLKLVKSRYELNQQGYEEAMENIPEEFRDNWNILFSLIMQYIITYFEGRRGAEGIEMLTKNHWKLVNENGKRYLKKVILFGTIP